MRRDLANIKNNKGDDNDDNNRLIIVSVSVHHRNGYSFMSISLQLSEVLAFKKTEMGKKEESVVTIRLGHLNNICNSRGVRFIPERDARDSIERFDLGEYLFYINVLGKISRLLC